jgi:hypothetical protein
LDGLGQARNLIKPETRVDLLGNKLVVVAPSDAKFTTLALERNALLSALSFLQSDSARTVFAAQGFAVLPRPGTTK